MSSNPPQPPDRFQVFNEGLLYCAIKLLLKDLNMDVDNSDELDKDLDLVNMDETDKGLSGPFGSRNLTPEQILQYWNSSFEKDTLSCLHFRDWWRQKVPKIFTPIPSMNYQKPNEHIEEEDVRRYFFDILERFLCNGDPSEMFKKLSSMNAPQTQCGKVFKIGEPTYSCRDCGLDPTCVLCVDCFKNSQHGKCRYKMSTSIGGGYCDCGDVEAWRDNAHCSIHKPVSGSALADPLANVPLDIQKRASLVFSSVLKYAHELLTLDTFMKLPGDLQYKSDREPMDLIDDLLEVEDMFATVLFNDEVHTFDEVINTLMKALDNCDKNKATSFVTLIDKEGRALVKCSQFQQCTEVKRVVERITGRRAGIKPLKVMVIHSHVIAHQVFALRLVSWLDGILAHSEGFRVLFSRILIEQEVGSNGRKQPSLLEGFLKHDTVLWKAARSSIHHLLISGMLLEHVSKKDFATSFTNSYGAIMKDFITDDHDHSYSVTSLSVQLFTVPTLAHYLVAHQDVLATLVRTFMSECEKKKNSKGKLEFERNLGMPAFRRANFILIDLKYILSIPPSDIDDNTRKGFLHGYSMLLDILTWMQGMDCHTRQINQHIEFEADWENGFNLHMKLAPVIQLLLNWCARDKVIFIKAYRMLLKKLLEEINNEKFSHHQMSLAGVTRDLVEYNVSTQPVSLHLPLVRLLAAMSLHLDTFGLSYNCDDFKLMERDMPSLDSLLELPLRTSVLVSQVHAGMWRRNGYSLQHQIYFYHNARCRGEMYDRDIQALQLCAANMDQNHFILQLLDKFGLVHWADSEFQISEEESIRHLTVLVEEFFSLLITILGERYTPGVGDIGLEDMVRKEIIQLLCVEPMSHSILNKCLPEDVNHETGLEKVIDQVAVFKKPTGPNSKGVYELKDKFYQDYNVFFYHYTREDQSKSEEAQRSRLKAANKPMVCPPPQLPALCKTFAPLSNLLESDLMLHLLTLVLKRADDLKSRCFSESQVHKVLFLIGMGLLEEQRLKQANPDTAYKFSEKASDLGMLTAMETLTGSYRIDSHKELLAWTIKMFKKARGLEEKMEVSEEVEEDDDEARKKRAKAAAERRKKIMAQMANQQKNFMAENSTLFDDTSSGLGNNRDRLISTTEWEDEESGDSSQSVCLGPARSQASATETDFVCILCQEEENLSVDCNTLVMCSYVQKSTVLAKSRNQATGSSMSPSSFPFLASNLTSSPHTSSCGHVMHATCWQKYFDDVSEAEKRRYRTRHPTSFDVEKGEFLCPLCRSLSNSVIPLIPQYHLLQQPGKKMADEPMEVNVSSGDGMEIVEENREIAEIVVDESRTTDSVSDNAADEGETVVEGAPEAARASPVISEQLDTAVATSVTVVNSPEASESLQENIFGSPASSHSSSSTELASAHSNHSSYSETFLSASESPKVEREGDGKPAQSEKINSAAIRAGVTIDFSQWLEAMLISLNYKRGLSSDQVSPPPNGGESQPQDMEVTESCNMTRYYTCPLDQVVEELNQKHLDGNSFSKLYLVDDGCELVFRTSVYEIMNSFSQKTYSEGLEGLPSLQDERIPLMVWQSCSFTVHSIVVSAMDAEKPVFGSLSSRHNDCLTALIRFCGVVGSNFGEPKVIRSHSLKLLSTLLEADSSNPCLLELDMFGILVSLTFSLPSLFNGEGPAPLPSCNIQDSHILRLVFLAHVTQILHSIIGEELSTSDWSHCPPEKECVSLSDLLEVISDSVCQNSSDSNKFDTLAVWQQVMSQSLGFLRCAALFYHYLSGVSFPTELTSLLPPDIEFINLAKYLNLPYSPKHLFNSPYTLPLVRKWTSHPDIIDQTKLSSKQRFMASVPSLITLPEDYSELINNISSFTCPRSQGEESRIPCMCLVCGQVVCSQSFCCQSELESQQVGACTAHAHCCGAGTGVFLKVKDCKILMFSGRGKGCYVSAPYLDQYGETDQGLKRGNPLKLCQERYTKLHKLWLNHGIAEEVTHNLEQSPTLVATDWNHL